MSESEQKNLNRSEILKSGARLCVDDAAAKGFQDLGMEPSFEAEEAISRAYGLPKPNSLPWAMNPRVFEAYFS